MPHIPLQFVFQGGGAKLGALVAAAEAVYDQRDTFGYTITSVSGTSAGAIAACMLASGRIGELRERLLDISGDYVKKIIKRNSWYSTGWKLYSGRPLYDTDQYSKFLKELFKVGNTEFRFLSDLDDQYEVLVHAVDIKNKKPKICKKSLHGDVEIARALLDSSALPFIFRTYSDKGGVFDGGMINNFPSTDLISDKERGDVVGFSFEGNDSEDEFSNIKEFSEAIISTMIDNATKASIEKLKSGDVHKIKTNRRTLDFEGAIKDDLSGKNYSDFKSGSENFLRDTCRRIRSRHLETSPADFIKNVVKLHDKLSSRLKVHVENMVLKYTCNALNERSRMVDDIREIDMDMTPVNATIFTYGWRFESSGPLKSKVEAFDADGNVIETTTLVVPREHDVMRDGRFCDNVIVIFNQGLQIGQKCKLKIVSFGNEILYNVIDASKMYRDDIGFIMKELDSIECLTFVAYVPETLRLQLMDIDVSGRPGYATWRSGAELNAGAIARLVGVPNPGFRAIGWQTKHLSGREASGFTARAI